jgi:thiol-disulfide isomerase/thioredoxin
MKKLLLSAILLFSLLSSLHAENSQAMTITDTNGKAYQITGTQEGLNIKGLEGKIVILEFFGHKCPPCLKSIPHLIDLQKKHKDKLVVVGIEVQGLSRAQLAAFAKTKGMNYITVSQDDAGIFVQYITQRAQWRGSIPFMVALDKKGVVQFVQAGMLPESSLEELVRQLK